MLLIWKAVSGRAKECKNPQAISDLFQSHVSQSGAIIPHVF